MRGIDRPLAELADHQHGLVTSHQLRELGISDHRRRAILRTGRLVELHPGVHRVGGADLGWPQQLRAACLSTTGLGVASHRAAARLWGLDGVPRVPVEITVLRGDRPASRRGVVLHESTDLVPVDCTRRDGIPVTTVVRTLIDLGGVVRAEVLETALDDAVRRELLTIGQLQMRFLEIARRGRRGVGALRPLLAARTGDAVGPGSPFEARVLRLIRAHGLPEPVCQHRVEGPGWRYFVDFAWPEPMVAVECDSLAFHFGRRRLQWDDTRQNRLVMAGWMVLRFTWQDVADHPGRVVGQLDRALDRHHRTA